MATSPKSNSGVLKSASISAVLLTPLVAGAWEGSARLEIEAWAASVVVIITMTAYGLYRVLKPAFPKHHVRFISLAASLLLLTGAALIRMSEKLHSSAFNNLISLAVYSSAACGVYRLVMLTPEKLRRWIAMAIVVVLSLALASHVYIAYYKRPHHPCCPPDIPLGSNAFRCKPCFPVTTNTRE